MGAVGGAPAAQTLGGLGRVLGALADRRSCWLDAAAIQGALIAVVAGALLHIVGAHAINSPGATGAAGTAFAVRTVLPAAAFRHPARCRILHAHAVDLAAEWQRAGAAELTAVLAHLFSAVEGVDGVDALSKYVTIAIFDDVVAACSIGAAGAVPTLGTRLGVGDTFLAVGKRIPQVIRAEWAAIFLVRGAHGVW